MPSGQSQWKRIETTSVQDPYTKVQHFPMPRFSNRTQTLPSKY